MKLKLVLPILFLLSFFGLAQVSPDCSTATAICSNTGTGGNVQGFGIDDFNRRTFVGCLGQALTTSFIESNSAWFVFRVTEAGTLGFDIDPDNNSEDWDFALFGPFQDVQGNCAAIANGNPIRCNYSGTPGFTGVGVNPTTGNQSDTYDRFLNVSANQVYVLFINNFSGANTGFNLLFTGSIFQGGNNPLDCSIVADGLLGSDQDICGNNPVDLNANPNNDPSFVEFFWELDEGSGFSEIPRTRNQEVIQVNQSGTYKVTITNNVGGTGTDEVIVNFFEIPVIDNAPNSMEKCDADNDGQEFFNLTDNNSVVLGSQTGMQVTYHTSQADANSGDNPITNDTAFPKTSNNTPQTIWVRIENMGNTDCSVTSSFTITAYFEPQAENVTDLLCDNGANSIRLSDYNSQVYTGNETVNISYHLTQQEADLNENPQTTLNGSIGSDNTRFVRVENPDFTDCFSTSLLTIEIYQVPVIANTPNSIEQCDSDNDGQELFNLSLNNSVVIGSQSDVNVSYHTTENGALNRDDVITNDTAFPRLNDPNSQTIWVRVESIGNTDCFVTSSFTITSHALPEFTIINPIVECEENRTFNDLSSLFDNQIYTGNLTNVGISYHLSLTDAQDNLNPQTNFTADIGTDELFVRLVNLDSPITCAAFGNDFRIDFDIEASPALRTSPALPTLCITNVSSIIDYDLNQAAEALFEDTTGLNFTYFLNAQDINNPNLALPNPYPINTQQNPGGLLVFVRGESERGCSQVSSVLITYNVTNSRNLNVPAIQSCEDSDGIFNNNQAQFDLSVYETELRNFLGSNANLSYHTSEVNAQGLVNPISDIQNYVGEAGTIYVRGTFDSQCLGIAQFDVEILENASVSLSSNLFQICPGQSTTITATGDFDRVEWFLDTVLVGSSTDLNADQTGTYTLIGYNTYNSPSAGIIECASEPFNFEVQLANTPTIERIDIIQNQSVTIVPAEGNLFPPFEYRIDNGPWQSSPEFDFNSLSPGQHFAQMRNSFDQACEGTPFSFVIISFTNFISPNGDGINDTWEIEGIEFLDEASFKVFDRYGKSIINQTIQMANFSWDGTYLSRPLPSATYWYIIQLSDGQRFTGYLTIKRE